MYIEPYRDALSRFPAGVVVVTAINGQGEMKGLTVSAFCSVSVEPPLVLVCVDAGSNTLPAILDSSAFTINILAAGRESLARVFASKGEGKFDGVEWIRSQALDHAGPILHNDVAAYLICSLEQTVEAGDHHVLIGRVAEVGSSESEEEALVYHRRNFSAVGSGCA